jgi:hypothetical protein
MSSQLFNVNYYFAKQTIHYSEKKIVMLQEEGSEALLICLYCFHNSFWKTRIVYCFMKEYQPT